MVTVIAILAFQVSCTKNHWFGNKSAPLRVLTQSSQDASGLCKSFLSIFQDQDWQSYQTLECLVTKVEGIWDKIDGKQKNELSNSELQILIRKGLVNLGDTAEKTYAKLNAIRMLLGLSPEAFKKDEIEKWISWWRENRSLLRDEYQKLSDRSEFVRYEDLLKSSKVIASFFSHAHWLLSSEELALQILILTEPEDRYVAKSVAPVFKTIADLLGVTCPNMPNSGNWDAEIISSCLPKVFEHFKSAAYWIEYVLNPSLVDPDPTKSKEALRELTFTASQWFQEPSLHPLHTRIWLDLASSVGVQPPDDILQALSVIRRLGTRITEELIYPEGVVHILDTIRRFQDKLMEGLHVFVKAQRLDHCQNMNPQTWKDCILRTDEPEIKSSPAYQLAKQVHNLHYGQKVNPLNGKEFLKTTFFQSLVEEIFTAFDDDGDGFISAETSDGNNELFNIIYFVSQFWDLLHRFYANILQKIDGKPLDESPPLRTFEGINLYGMSKLVALISEMLVTRTPEQRNEIERLVSNLTNVIPGSTLVLDRPSTLAALLFVDSLSEYRQAFLSGSGLEVSFDDKKNPVVKKAALKTAIPVILAQHFPRTFESCLSFGFQKSCKLLFDRVMPFEKQGSFIAVSDFDLITTIAVGAEGLIDACDENNDGKLTWKLFDGADELDCGFTKLKDTILRLMESKVIRPKNQDLIRATLETLNSFFLFRKVGKISMVRGSKAGVLYLPVFFLYDSATLGSLYSLFADLIKN